MKKYTILISAFFILCTNFIVAQNTFKDGNLWVSYEGSSIKLQTDDKKTVLISASLKDVISKQELHLETKHSNNSLNLLNVPSGRILEASLKIFDGNDTLTSVKRIATISSSTGNIKVYFNHPVETTAAQSQVAINLADHLDDTLINYINRCHNKLDIAIYSSSSPSSTTGIAGAINDAYTRGVSVRVIYDGSTTSQMIPLLNSAIPRIASPIGDGTNQFGIMHNKFVLFDANDLNPNLPIVWTGSTNWTVSQIDGPDKNSAIIVQDQSLALAYTIEFEEMWGSNTMMPNPTNSKFGYQKTNNTPHTFIIGGRTVENYFSPSDGANSKIINAINSANSDINIATMVETRTDIKNALLAKYNGGVSNINVLLDNQNPSGNQISNLQSGLAPNHAVSYNLAGIMHHKFMVVDNFNATSDPLVLVGSHNWSTSAETKNDENILIVHDASIANQYYQAFVYLYQQMSGTLTTTQQNLSESSIVIYPNPTNNELTIELKDTKILENATVLVHDCVGKIVGVYSFQELQKETISVNNLARGMYFITLSSNSLSSSFKFTKL